MGSYREILLSVNDNKGGLSIEKLNGKRENLLSEIAKHRNRNIITYYSGWMFMKNAAETMINDKDVNALMEVIHGLDRKKGLDLVLHTPGGEIAATEQIINYLHACFKEITVIVPQMAMSAGSIISVSCDEIIMGKQSCLGPFDPQLNGFACQSVLREFEKAKDDVKKHPEAMGLWQVIINKYTPTFLDSCEQAIALTDELAEKYLSKKFPDKKVLETIKKAFNNNSESKIHSRHYSKEKLKNLGLNIKSLEEDQTLQDLVLSLHHCYMILLENLNVCKCVENNIQGHYIRQISIPQPAFPQGKH